MPGRSAQANCSRILGVPITDIDKALLRLEASGAVLRGKFTDLALPAKSSGASDACWRGFIV